MSGATQRIPFAALDPDAPPSTWAQPAAANSNDVARPRHVHIHLTPFAFPGEIAPHVGHPSRAMVHWSVSALRPMRDLCARLERSARSLSVQDRPESGDIEILGRVKSEPQPVVLALVGYGLTAEECRLALQQLSA